MNQNVILNIVVFRYLGFLLEMRLSALFKQIDVNTRIDLAFSYFLKRFINTIRLHPLHYKVILHTQLLTFFNQSLKHKSVLLLLLMIEQSKLQRIVLAFNLIIDHLSRDPRSRFYLYLSLYLKSLLLLF